MGDDLGAPVLLMILQDKLTHNCFKDVNYKRILLEIRHQKMIFNFKRCLNLSGTAISTNLLSGCL